MVKVFVDLNKRFQIPQNQNERNSPNAFVCTKSISLTLNNRSDEYSALVRLLYPLKSLTKNKMPYKDKIVFFEVFVHIYYQFIIITLVIFKL